MAFSIENLKGEINRGGGLAKGNLFRVILPLIPEIYTTTSPTIGVSFPLNMNILCKSVNMPGRQLLTSERTIGVVSQKVVYGYANEDVNMSFVGLNDYLVRKYFEDWQFFSMNENTHEVKYKNEYARDVIIQQLDARHRVVYAVKLYDAFPTQILNIDFANDNNTPLDINVTLSYTKWRRENTPNNFGIGVGTEILEDLILRN